MRAGCRRANWISLLPTRSVILLVLALAGFSGLAAQTSVPQFERFQRYSPPVATGIRFSSAELAWFNQIFDLMASDDFTFIYRQDSDHWAGIYRQRLDLILHIHNTDAQFDFRARIDRSTGMINLLRGVEYRGIGPLDSARISSESAVAYIQHLLTTGDSFTQRQASPTMATSVSRSTGKTSVRERASENQATKIEDPIVSSAPVAGGVNAADPISRLLEGNRRFVTGQALHIHQTVARRTEIAAAQHPFTIVVTCSDSRLPPEIIFDQGLGDLFVVRTAGEVVGDLELGSIEYAVEYLQVRHILVLGHQRCSAVAATIEGGEVPENILRIVMRIRDAVGSARQQKGDLLDNASRQNVLNVVNDIRESAIVGELIQEKLLSINAGFYNIDTGKVSILE